MRKPVDIVIATSDRLKDHMDRGSVELLVLDEAARRLEMRFQEEIDSIIARAPKDRSTQLFSATLQGVVDHLASRASRNPKRVEIAHARSRAHRRRRARHRRAGINLVVNYDARRQAEDYVHRIGRTGRGGRAASP